MTSAQLHTFEGAIPAVAALAWRLGSPRRVASTASVGGGVGERDWILNAQVPLDYARRDVDVHVGEIALALGLVGPGVGMLTAALVASVATASEDGITVEATVGLSRPVWAAADDEVEEYIVGTINTVATLSVPHTDGALANLLCTATEAKVQALFDGGIPGTGTASDAVTVVCPVGGPGVLEPFGGPRSRHGASVARCVHAAIGSALAGAEGDR